MKQTYIKVEETYDVVTNGLILYLDAKDSNSYPGTGNIWYDISGNNHHAYGDPNDGGAGTLDTRFPTYQTTDGGRFYFDGTKGLTIPTDMGNHTELTTDFWCYRDSSSGSQYFFDGRNDGGDWWLSNYIDHNININDSLKANDPATYNATSNWWFRWVNITITVNSSGSALYIDGQQITDSRLISSDTFSANLGNYFRIGNRSTSSGEWIGYWSNIRFYNRVLSSAEIEQNYKAVNGDTTGNFIWKEVKNVWVNNSGTWEQEVVPKINVSGWDDNIYHLNSGLLGWWDSDDIILDGTEVQQMNDKSGNNNHVSQSTSTNRPVYINDEVYFDGNNDFLQGDQVFDGIGDFTIGCWFRCDTGSVYGDLVSIRENINDSQQTGLIVTRVDLQQKLQMIIRDVNSNIYFLNTTNTYNDGVWHLVLFRRKGDIVSIDVDEGNEIVSETCTTGDVVSSSNVLRIGGFVNAGNYYSGYIRGIRIYDKYLSYPWKAAKEYDLLGNNLIKIDWENYVGTGITDYFLNYTFGGANNSRLYDINPYGNTDVVWQGSGTTSTSRAYMRTRITGPLYDNQYIVPVYNTKHYRYSCFIKKKESGSITGRFYFGCYPRYNGSSVSLERVDTTGTASTIYFLADTTPDFVEGDWYLMVAYIRSINYTGGADANYNTKAYRMDGSELYDNPAQWKFYENCNHIQTNIFAPYNGTDIYQFYQPRIDEINGSEPTITQLLNG